MSNQPDTRSLVQELVAMGLDPIDAADIIMRAALMGAATVAQGSKETPEERKKRISRETSQRHRMSQNVTSVSPANADDRDANVSPNVTSVSPNVTLARVRDNNPRLVISGNNTTPYSASERAPDPVALLEILRQAAGPAAPDPARHAGIANVSAVLRLLNPNGQGPPCDLELDILPIIRGRCASAQPNTIRGWSYFENAIIESRDRRLSGPPPVTERAHAPAPRSAKFDAKQANLDRAFRAGQAVAQLADAGCG